ncbi:TonB-dependent receptor [Alloacidobacterium sp.]|uniref:TonB-dependent receptor n=1 Tax=Alloacidobacterium sp. TaxID=2951999 RepID=UPI002D404E2E|nr:TonB-dependent receptor [Alloacidobacterium sp.]HYK35160.1 TonB-dependent receptor [Alloacidobacterium sp.]
MRRVVLWCFALGMLLGYSGIHQYAWGQQITAAITGTVVDAAGAVLSGATVTATDADRGTVYVTKTNDSGIFNFTQVPIGTYDVKIEASGFETTVRSHVTLVLNQTARLDFKMQVGAVTNTVQVTSEAPQLQSDTTQVSTLINSRAVTDIPLATRNYVELTLLAPGSIHPDNSTFNNGDNTASGGRPYINGNREQSNNFILDGMDNNQTSDNLLAVTPAPDAIQEFNLITSNAPAEFGNFQGGIVNASIKSGTNSFHGDVWEFFRNDVLNANQWENKFLGPGNELKRAALRWNMYGGTIGGPIIKDKLFFFADYQGQRFDHPASSNFITVFTNAERNGDFSALLPGIQLKDPITGAPYTNNQIPTSQENIVAQNLFASKYYPQPINGNSINNAVNTVTQAYNDDQGDVKVDYNITEKDRFSGRYSQAYQNDPGSNSLLILGNGFAQAPIHNVVGTWTHTFSPSILNEARFGTSWITLFNGAAFDPSIGDLGTSLGIANANSAGPGLLLLGFNGGTAPSPGGGGTLTNVGSNVVQQDFADTVIQFNDGLVITHGKHVFKTGFQMWRYRVNTFYTGNSGAYGSILFSGQFSGDAGADFFLGYPEATGKGVSSGGSWHQFSWTYAGYFQDDWRLTPSLTLNLGLRYEAHTPWVELNNLQDNMNLETGEVEYAGKNGNSRALYNSVYGQNAFQPRFGFAWSPEALHGKAVVRGAYTISSYLEGTGTNLRLPRNPPFTPAEVTATYKTPSYMTQQGPGGASPTDPFAGAVMYVWDKTVQPAQDQQWNFTVQDAITPSTTIQAGYVGQHGTHLMVPTPFAQEQLVNGQPEPGVYFQGPNSILSDISTVSGTASTGYMNYNALQTVLQQRLSNGLEGQVAYTWSHCLTNNSGYYGTWGSATQATPASPYYQNLYNPGADYASCYYDSKSNLSTYATYELPFGRGKKFGADANRVVNGVIGGWQASTIISIHGGFPLAVYDDYDASGTGGRGPRPNCGQQQIFGRQKSFGSSGAFQGYQWMSPSGYSEPVPGTFGNCPAQGPVRGPGYTDTDLGLSKNIHFSERMYMQFRTDFLNAFNNVQLGHPNTSFAPNPGTFGLINTSQPARNIQFALKFYY